MIHFYLQTLVLTHLSVFLVCILQVLARLGLTPVSPTKATVHRVPSAHTSQTSGRSSASRVLPASPPTSGELPARTSVSVSSLQQFTNFIIQWNTSLTESTVKNQAEIVLKEGWFFVKGLCARKCVEKGFRRNKMSRLSLQISLHQL